VPTLVEVIVTELWRRSRDSRREGALDLGLGAGSRPAAIVCSMERGNA
jgi:hypothetical protein